MEAGMVTEVEAVVSIIIKSVMRRLAQLDNGFLKLLAMLFPLSTSSEITAVDVDDDTVVVDLTTVTL